MRILPGLFLAAQSIVIDNVPGGEPLPCACFYFMVSHAVFPSYPDFSIAIFRRLTLRTFTSRVFAGG